MEYFSKNDELWKAIEEIALAEGLVIYDLERPGNNKLQVVVARPEQHLLDNEAKLKCDLGQGGVTSEDCSKLVRELIVYFQMQGGCFGFGMEPEIEVSSPGINRRLRLTEHFIGAVGERVRVVLKNSDSLRGNSLKMHNLTGELKFCDGVEVIIADEANKNEERNFKISEIKKAKVDFDFGDGNKSKLR